MSCIFINNYLIYGKLNGKCIHCFSMLFVKKKLCEYSNSFIYERIENHSQIKF